jgi:adenylylsulfate kinase
VKVESGSMEKLAVSSNDIITKESRQALNGHKSMVIWFTGISGSGKSTLSSKLEKKLFGQGIRTYVLDADSIRKGLNRGLGFSRQDREENIRRVGEVAKLFVDAGVVVLTAFISPFQKDRERARSLVEADEFIEIYLKCPLEICEKRDVKGLYAKARRGDLRQFTAIDDPYEEPVNPEITLETDKMSVEECLETILVFLEKRGLIATARDSDLQQNRDWILNG